jgi:glucose uptake protein GlcU
MEMIIGFGFLLLTFIGVFLLVKANKKDRKTENKPQEVVAPPSDCCGAHEICEFDQMKMNESVIEYYDDEELDAYKNIDEDSYTNNQIEQFREVLYTLKTEEIKYWLLSIERRHIQLPEILKSEARMLMAEA